MTYPSEQSSELANAGMCIRIAQEVRNISTAELCDRMSVKRQQLHRWRNSRNLKLHTVQQFADIFGMPLDQFCTLDKRCK